MNRGVKLGHRGKRGQISLPGREIRNVESQYGKAPKRNLTARCPIHELRGDRSGPQAVVGQLIYYHHFSGFGGRPEHPQRLVVYLAFR